MTDYVTIAEVKGHAASIDFSTTYDELIPQLITRASEYVDRATRRDVGAFDADSVAAAARWFDGEGGLYQAIDECTAVSAVTIRRSTGSTTETALASTDYYTYPYNASAATGPIIRLDMDRRQGSYDQWPTGRKAVKVTATWGYSDAPPAVVKEATIIQVIRWLKRGQQLFADANLVATAGRLVYAKKLDPDLGNLLFGAGLLKKKDLF